MPATVVAECCARARAGFHRRRRRSGACACAGAAWQLRIGGAPLQPGVHALRTAGWTSTLDGERQPRLRRAATAKRYSVRQGGESWRLRLPDPIAAAAEEDDAGGRLVAPIPGQVTEVLAAPGWR